MPGRTLRPRQSTRTCVHLAECFQPLVLLLGNSFCLHTSCETISKTKRLSNYWIIVYPQSCFSSFLWPRSSMSWISLVAAVNACTTSISNQDKAYFLRSIMALKTFWYSQSPMAVHCVLERTLKGVLGHQSFRLSSHERKCHLLLQTQCRCRKEGREWGVKARRLCPAWGRKPLRGNGPKWHVCITFISDSVHIHAWWVMPIVCRTCGCYFGTLGTQYTITRAVFWWEANQRM